MEDKCFQEGCEQEAFLLCKCTDPPTGVCELHFPEHLRKKRFGIHNHLILKVYVDPSDSQEVIEVLESHKKNIYSNMQKLAQVTKQLHLSIEAEFAKELNELRKREMEIQKLIEELSDLTEFKIGQENTTLCDLFSNNGRRRAKCLSKYEELSKVFNFSELQKSCERIFSQNAHLNYLVDAVEVENFLSEDNKVYQFSKTSSALITYNLSTMEKTERFIEGELLGASIKCVLPDGRLFCYKESTKSCFLFDVDKNTFTPVNKPTFEPTSYFSGVTESIKDTNALVDDDVIHFVGIRYRRNSVSDVYMQFNLKTMRWGVSAHNQLNLEGFSGRQANLIKFEGRIYATNSLSEYVYMYSRDMKKLIEIFKLNASRNKLLFEHGSRLFLLTHIDLYCMESSSKTFSRVGRIVPVGISYFGNFFGTSPYWTKTSENLVIFCCNNEAPYVLNLETQKITQPPFSGART